jgi:hypothetical protein
VWILETEFLILGKTGFAGDLPVLPSGVIEFEATFALFDGGLNDAAFQDAQGLEYVFLDGNAFNATVPAVLGSLPELQFLYISDCSISGDLSYMQGMPKLFEHWIDVNPSLTGPVFPFIGSLSPLALFSVMANSLTGTLPTELGNLFNMKQMWYYDNDLTGMIPSELGNLNAMRLLQVEGNAFTGTIPTQVCENIGFLQPLLILGADCLDANFKVRTLF